MADSGEEKVIVFTADIPEKIAKKFDDIAKKEIRSRAAHLRWLVEQHVTKREKLPPF